MERKDFISKIVERGYEWADYEHDGEKGYAIKKGDTKIFISFDGIGKQDWDTIKKGVPDLVHMTRIVGYYSKIHNWNRSKLGELSDRHAGEYIVK